MAAVDLRLCVSAAVQRAALAATGPARESAGGQPHFLRSGIHDV
jgi:hypothetical protein